ncbi:GPI-linked NAD(P)(+)--arginine ADP-ribosyltransferase 1 [Triplophysa rosa]|uniref:NAD(P)(+)--arginine ADP-ribosyltransferase n=1 Tax=Triplophysa rosa TaxID=992332 RepID=A0A9W7WZ75_TRIRA|nr:GPI-linked NAD(P)(+)--arginine ADP-ribosyltransferase 1 [Triplophysa rosa]KAI7810905.1 putative GPI-linked NADP+--arginine ADP-ribosyltransferase 1 [Triplophysa rosa]
MGTVRFPALLFVLLYSTVGRVADVVIKLDMFPKVVDYSSCRDEMLQIVTKPGGLLQQELNNSTDFKLMWKANATCEEKIPGATQEHMAALKSYADASPKFHELFNMKLYSKGKNITTYQNEFPFKSLYFLLTDAMQRLSKDMCQMIYSGIENEELTAGDLVRFGTFLPARLKYSDALEDIVDVSGTVFNITSCSVFNLDEKCKSDEIDLLISPMESFKVKEIRTSVDNGDETYKQVALVQHSFRSSFDCKSFFRSSSKPERSSSNLLCSSLTKLMAPFVMVYLYKLDL